MISFGILTIDALIGRDGMVKGLVEIVKFSPSVGEVTLKSIMYPLPNCVISKLLKLAQPLTNCTVRLPSKIADGFEPVPSRKLAVIIHGLPAVPRLVITRP